MADLPSASNFEEENYLRFSLFKAVQEEEILVKQKSRIDWLGKGDNNNKLFFNSCKARWNINKLLALEDDSGCIHSSHDKVSNIAVNYYENLLGSEHEVAAFPDNLQLPTLSESQRSFLVTPFKPEDVLKTLKSMSKNKCAGPDGFSVEFFLSAWSIIGNDVIKGIIYYFDSLELPRIVNATALALIPKHISRLLSTVFGKKGTPGFILLPTLSTLISAQDLSQHDSGKIDWFSRHVPMEKLASV
ncbi:hypothetical protein AgCh_038843 [Apium graveolens]